MSFNFAKYILPPGALIQFKPDNTVINTNLDWSFSHLGIEPNDVGLVLQHSKPVYLKVLVNERIHNLDLSGFTTIFGCWVHEISVISLPAEYVSKNTQQLW